MIEQTQFLEPYPINGAKNVPLKYLQIGFKNIFDKRKIYKRYLDTINPTKHELDSLMPRIPPFISCNYLFQQKCDNRMEAFFQFN